MRYFGSVYVYKCLLLSACFQNQSGFDVLNAQ